MLRNIRKTLIGVLIIGIVLSGIPGQYGLPVIVGTAMAADPPFDNVTRSEPIGGSRGGNLKYNDGKYYGANTVFIFRYDETTAAFETKYDYGANTTVGNIGGMVWANDRLYMVSTEATENFGYIDDLSDNTFTDFTSNYTSQSGTPVGLANATDSGFYVLYDDGGVYEIDAFGNLEDSSTLDNALPTADIRDMWKGTDGNYYVAKGPGSNVVWRFNQSGGSVDWGNVSKTWNLDDNPEVNGTVTGITQNGTGNFMVTNDASNDEVLWFGAVSAGPGPSPGDTGNITLEVDPWMPQNSSQKYRVTLNNSSGVFDVTDSSSVTSNNTSVITVDQANNTLNSLAVNDTVLIEATFDGQTDNKTVTVATRTLDNIGILPPEQFICGYFECDGGGPFNIGSQMQWLWLLIILMVTATRMFENPWAGLGSGGIIAILLWVMGNINLALLLPTVFVLILLSVIMIRAKRGRSDTFSDPGA